MSWPLINLETALASAEAFIDGDWVETKDQDPEGNVRLVQLADVGDGCYLDKSSRFLTSEKAATLRCTFLKRGDVLVARMPDPLGRACLFPGDSKRSVTVVDVCVIRPNPNEQDARWLMHCLNAPAVRSQIAGLASGTTRSRISRGNLKKITIRQPPLAEQRRIAEVLDRAEGLRVKRRAALAKLDTLIQSLYLDLFGHPASNSKKWSFGRIGDLLESASYGTSEKASATGEFPVLRMNNITRTGEIDLTDLKFMDLPTRQRERYLVRAGDVLFNRTNSPDLVGKTAIVRETRPMAYAGYLVRLRVNDKNDPEYLAAFLNTGYAKSMLRGMCKSIIGMANINATEIQAMRIPQTPLDLQREFARRIAAVQRLRDAYRASLAKLDELFASLQDRAFRGELFEDQSNDEPLRLSLLRIEWPALFEAATRPRRACYTDPADRVLLCAARAGAGGDWALQARRVAAAPVPGQPERAYARADLQERRRARRCSPRRRIINDLGNRAVHSRQACPQPTRSSPRRELFHVGYWLARTYARGAKPRPASPSTPTALPQTRAASQSRRSSSSRSSRPTRERDEKLAELLAASRRSTQELERLRAEVAEAKKAARRPARTRTTTPRPRRATTSSTCCSRRPAGRSTETRDREFEVSGMPNDAGSGLRRLRALGRRRQAARAGRGQAHARDRASGSSRRSSTRTASRSSSASGRSSSTRTATSTGCGTTRATRRARCRASTRRRSWSC